MRRLHIQLLIVAAWIALALAYVLGVSPADFSRLIKRDAFASVEPKVSDEVRVCTWNLRNYGLSKRIVDGKWREHPKPEAEKRAIRAILKEINADVLLLDEISDESFLLELRSSLLSDGLAYKYWAIGKNPAPIRVGILSKIKPENIEDKSLTFFQLGVDRRASPRGTVGAVFKTNSIVWEIFAVHLKSKYGARKSENDFIEFRAGELAAILSRTNSNLPVIVGGDFNDEPVRILKTAKEFGFDFINQRDPAGKIYSYYWAKKDLHFCYDGFYANRKMKKFITGDARIYPSEKSACSDHRPVYLDLRFSQGAAGVSSEKSGN